MHENREFAETRWSDALSSTGLRAERYGGVRFGKRLVDSRSIRVPVAPADAFEPIRCIGGASGWYFGDALWHLRGFLDLLVGGVGLRRGRRDPEQLTQGAPLDFWRIEAVEPDHLLRLRAEMKLPGRAWLQFEVDGDTGGSTIRQTAIFDPVGLPAPRTGTGSSLSTPGCSPACSAGSRRPLPLLHGRSRAARRPPS